jgi:hypothetical protein
MFGTILHDTHSWSDVVSSESSNLTTNPINSPQVESCEYLVESETYTGEKGFVRGFSNEQFQQLVIRSPLLSEPTQLKYKGTLTLNVDANRVLLGFELVCEQIFFRSYSNVLSNNVYAEL